MSADRGLNRLMLRQNHQARQCLGGLAGKRGACERGVHRGRRQADAARGAHQP